MSQLGEEEILKICKASKITSETLKLIEKIAKPGMSTQDLDNEAEKYILSCKAKPAFKGYRGFPASICVSINEEIVHGIPGERKIGNSDLVSVDVGVNLDGLFADAAITLIIGKVDRERAKLVKITKDALYKGIDKVRAGNRLYDVSAAIQKHAEKNGFSVVRQFVGHCIGRQLHEDPQIPNFGQAGTGPVLKEGMLLAIEPMINMGTWEVEILPNGWTAVTKDGKPSAHFEHTVLVTKEGSQILTI